MRSLMSLIAVALLCAGCSSSGGGGAGGGGGSGGSGGIATGGSGGSGACMPTSEPAARVTAALSVMMDQSAHMADPFVDTRSRWDDVTQAVTTFASQAAAPPVQMGLSYYGLSQAGCPPACSKDADCGTFGPCTNGICLGCGGDSCTADEYATPDVEIAPLPVPAIATSLQMHSPSTGRPTSAALQGLLGHARSFASAHAHVVAAGVLIAAGDPDECDTGASQLASTASAGLSGGVPTYVLSAGTVPSGDEVAAAGGTGAAQSVTSSADVLGALQGIADDVARCWFAVDGDSSAGVKLALRQGSTDIPRVTALSACAAGAGWVYAGNGLVVMCPASCTDTPPTALLGCPP